ncbi:MAG: methanogenesis marker 6 protein [Methanomicrobiaceae archaeon]|nr:methanogenesis marker 6 protein [Methanomicrobiaceae archaeon]
MKEYIPTYEGTVTRYVFVDSPDITPQTLATRAYEVSEGVMIKETCFGLQVTGMPGEVDRLIEHIREMDPNHIFVKDRGFPPGDPRRCRANLGGARPGYYGHEFEIGLIRFVSHGLDAIELMDEQDYPEVKPPWTAGPGLDARTLKRIIDAEEK